jgi:spermidine synthase
MGLSGIVAQILFLRELLVSFLGNELTLGIILANWLLLEAIGSFSIGRSVKRIEKKLEVYVSLQLIFSRPSFLRCRGRRLGWVRSSRLRFSSCCL